MNNIFNFKIVNSTNFIKVGFPISSLNKIVTKLSSVSQLLKDKVKNLTDRITTASNEGETNSRAISSIITNMRS